MTGFVLLRSCRAAGLAAPVAGLLAHHVIFAWNRLGLPYTAQAVLSATARTVIFGPDPTAENHR